MGYIYRTIRKALLLFLISAAILIASCRNPSGGSIPQDIPTEPDNTTLLGEKIDQAETLLGKLKVSEDGSDVSQDKYWVVSTWKLEVAIETAKDVLNNPKATAEQIQYALEELTKAYDEINTAKKPGKYGKTDVSQLVDLISQAQNLVSGLEVSTDGKNIYTDTYWVTDAQKQALISAISAAQIEAAKEFSTQDAADEALSALKAVYDAVANAKRLGTFVAKKDALQVQIATAKEKIDGVLHSADGNDIPKYETWVTKDKLDNLAAAITTADALMADSYARQSAVDAAIQALISAKTAFNPQEGKAPFDVSQLNDLITSAQDLLDELQKLQVSIDGTDVYEDTEWISASQIQALVDAISAAEIVAANEKVKPDEAEQALNALMVVYHNARAAKKFGTFTANKADLQENIALAYAKMAGILTSNNGLDVPTTDRWVTHEVMTALDAALIAAKTLNGEPYARQEAVNAAASELAATIAAFEPQQGRLTHGLVDSTFTGPDDEDIPLTDAKTLSWAENTKLTVTVTETFDSYQWYVDGVIKDGATGTSISLYAKEFSIGTHTLTLKVKKGGVPYTKTLKFTVN